MSPNKNTALTRRHNKNFENYITEYAKEHALGMNGSLWETALAAAKRLDYSQERHATNQSELIPAPSNFLGRFFRRLLPRREVEQLSETDAIRDFLQQAPQVAAQQSEIEWGALKDGMGTRMKARLLPGGQQKGEYFPLSVGAISDFRFQISNCRFLFSFLFKLILIRYWCIIIGYNHKHKNTIRCNKYLISNRNLKSEI